jgi:uncharacterized protein (TIGR02722 family)
MKTTRRLMISRCCLPVLSMALLLSACTNTVQYGQETRSETIRTEIGSADLQQGAQRLLTKMISTDRVASAASGSRPTLAYLPLIDQTDENLNISPLNASIVQQLQGFGRFQLAQQSNISKVHRDMLDKLDFRAVTTQTAAEFASQAGADLLLYGTITNVIRSKATSKEVYYRIALALWDNKAGEVIWRDDSEHLKTRKKIVFGL